MTFRLSYCLLVTTHASKSIDEKMSILVRGLIVIIDGILAHGHSRPY